jgi:HD-GYP domain-containing protein (c-di-GMP phosphodiesterase class II)
MVRMSDLVRGIVRPSPASAAPATEAPPEPKAEEQPAVVATSRVSIASSEPAQPVVRLEAVMAPRRPAESTEPLEPLFTDLQRVLIEARERVDRPGFPWAKLEAVVERVITAVLASPDLVWVASAASAAAGADYVVLHQARACVLALRLGVDLGYERPRLLPLGLAAALFDVGLWQAPATLLERLDTLSGADLSAYHAHPRASAEIVQRWSPSDSRIVDAIADHHERELGQGFPRGLQGGAIAVDAKIIGLVDTYAALTVPPAPRPRLRPHEAIRDIVKTRNDQFPSPLIKALLSEISVFPPGTIVRLNTEEVGRVIAVNRNHPLRPQVEIVADGKGQRLAAPKVIDLSESPFLYITGPVGESSR